MQENMITINIHTSYFFYIKITMAYVFILSQFLKNIYSIIVISK